MSDREVSLTADNQANATDARRDEGPRAGGPLRLLQDAFAARFAARAGALIGRELTVTPAGRSRQSYAEFLAALTEPTCCHILSGRPAAAGAAAHGGEQTTRHRVWVDADRSISFALIDALLGGTEGAYIPNRALTDVERGLLRHIIDAIAAGLGESWPGDDGRTFEVLGDEPCDGPQAEGQAHEPVTVLAFHLDLAGQGGTLRLCLPQSLLPAHAERDQAARTPSGPVEVSVVTAEIELSTSELADLAAGDILTTDTPADGEVVIRVAGIPKFGGRLGTCNGQRAVTITRRVSDRPKLPQGRLAGGQTNG